MTKSGAVLEPDKATIEKQGITPNLPCAETHGCTFKVFLIFLCSDQCSIFVDRTPKCNCIASEVASTPVWQGIGERVPLVLCPT